ncbi:MAG: MmcQ/YjbR family DNA-binding protein [Gemmatimonadota bacterium]|nr:MmcQ/YjbR family DNA-binding protein [Gemmatimonadota bacterium]
MPSTPAKKKSSKTARTAIPLAQLRKICLALPEAHEVEAWGAPTFRVKNKIFAMYGGDSSSHHSGRPGVWIKSKHTVQEIVLHSAPTKYFKPPYVGPGGWTGAYLDKKPDWKTISALLLDAYRQTAPKKLLVKLDDE